MGGLLLFSQNKDNAVGGGGFALSRLKGFVVRRVIAAYDRFPITGLDDVKWLSEEASQIIITLASWLVGSRVIFKNLPWGLDLL